MMEVCIGLLLLTPFVYYGLAIHYYIKKKELRTFLQLVIFPIPIMAFIGFILYESFKDPSFFDLTSKIFLGATIPVGIGIIAHICYERDRSLFTLLTRLPASCILIMTPLFLLHPELLDTFGILSFTIAGVLMGTYGYVTFYKGRRIGLIYGYLAIIFFVIAPVVCIAISIAYFELLKDNIIYRRSNWGESSCHDIGFPIFFIREGFIRPFLFATGYTGIMGIVAAIRKKTLEKRVRRERLIPKEFDRVLEGKGDEDG